MSRLCFLPWADLGGPTRALGTLWNVPRTSETSLGPHGSSTRARKCHRVGIWVIFSILWNDFGAKNVSQANTLAHAARVALRDRFLCPVRGFGGAALACAHCRKEAWDTVFSRTKSTLATFIHITFEATMHRILHGICAQILKDWRPKCYKKCSWDGFFSSSRF